MHPKINAIHRSDISEEIRDKLDSQSSQPSAGCQYVFSIRLIVGIGPDGQ
jgi:hypothetical protein